MIFSDKVFKIVPKFGDAMNHEFSLELFTEIFTENVKFICLIPLP